MKKRVRRLVLMLAVFSFAFGFFSIIMVSQLMVAPKAEASVLSRLYHRFFDRKHDYTPTPTPTTPTDPGTGSSETKAPPTTKDNKVPDLPPVSDTGGGANYTGISNGSGGGSGNSNGGNGGGSGNNSDSGSNANADMMPAFGFDLGSDTFGGTTKIKGKVEDADSVEFYAVKKGSISPEYYLCKADKVTSDKWQCDYDFSQLPIGDYELLAKIKNDYGTYQSARKAIHVKYSVGSPTPAVPIYNNTTDQGGGSGYSGSAGGSGGYYPNYSNNQPPPGRPDNEKQEPEIRLEQPKRSDQEAYSTFSDLKQINQEIEQVKNDPKLSNAQKEQKLKLLNQRKQDLLNRVTSTQQAEALLQISQEGLTEEDRQMIAEIKKQLIADTDKDGLSDYYEKMIGTNPNSADTDKDSYPDGAEIKAGHNPLVPSDGKDGDKIKFEEPKDKGKVNRAYKVDNVQYQIEKDGKKIKLQGKGLPNSFVTIYIYSSDPLVITVKTDEDGNWTYSLDKELDDGEHEVYVAVTDNTGKIISKSRPYAFIKTAEAIEKVDDMKLDAKSSPLQKNKTNFFVMVFLTSVFSLGLAVLAIGIHLRSAKRVDYIRWNKFRPLK